MAASMKSPEAPPPLGGILRRVGVRGGGTRQVRFALSAPEEEEEDGEDWGDPASPPPPPTLGTPTLHSSLGGPWGGPQEPFDAPRAAAALLGSSFAARCAVGGAAAGAMNVPPTQRLYRDLVSLAVPLPPPSMGSRRAVPAPPPTPKMPGPDPGALMGFGGVGEGGPWLPPPAPPPSAAPRPLPRAPGAAFVMYRKLLQWGGG